MATENKKGIQNLREDLPMMIDPNYVVGFTWARQYGFRVLKYFGGKFALGISVEGPQATIQSEILDKRTSSRARQANHRSETETDKAQHG